jgi:hypothetical protein
VIQLPSLLLLCFAFGQKPLKFTDHEKTNILDEQSSLQKGFAPNFTNHKQ